MIRRIRETARACPLPGLCTFLIFAIGCGMPPPDGNGPESAPLADGVFARLGEPLPSASDEQLATFERGKDVSLRRFDIVDGLGPDFNVTFCTACHERPATGGGAGLYRNFFLTGTVTEDGAFIDADFGGVVRRNRYTQVPGDFFPPVPTSLNVFAQRNPIPFFAAGLIAEISDEEILSRVDERDADGDGISGRANFDRGFVGRFGRKSQTVSIEGFIRGPLNNHLGITTDPLTEEQRARLPVDSSLQPGSPARVGPKPTAALQAAAPDGPLTDFDAAPDPEMSADDLFDLVSFAMLLAAPQPDEPTAQTTRGSALFASVGCTGCHVSRIEGPRGGLPIYSDFLLHDMGPDLADGIVQGEASGSEFRTQPLWGLAPVGPYLHDGRAERIETAILAHGGEAQRARDGFAALDATGRDDIVAFLRSLGGRDQFSTGLVPANTAMADVGTYGGPFRALTQDERTRFLAGREVFDREFGHETGAGALSTPGGPPRLNGDSCRACHFEPTIGGAGPRGVNVMRHGTVEANGSFSPPTTTPNTILHTQTTSAISSNTPEDGINVFEPRQPPHTFGLGLIDGIADETIRAGEDVDDADGDGIRGRAHVIVDAAGTRIGRLGWKAQVPSVAEFVRDAMAAEIGLTLPEQQGLTFGITEDGDDVPDPELLLEEAESVAFFLTMLAPPPRQAGADAPDVLRGQAVFTDVGCAKCHTPSLPATVDGAAIDVPLYSDLLLHEMLPAGRPGIEDGMAGQGEFRTAPLWGLSQTAPYLHTGEADTIHEAVRMHAGEATAVIDAYNALSADERADLLAFLETL